MEMFIDDFRSILAIVSFKGSIMYPFSSSISVLAPDCGILRGSLVSAWSVEILLKMTPVNFTDCLEEIGQDPDIPNSELAPLLARVLKVGITC